VDLRSGLRLLRERWKLISAVTVLAVLASGVATWLQTPQYESQVTMFVSARGSDADAADAYQGSLLSQQKVKSYAELLRAHRVMDGVVDRLGLGLSPAQLSGKVSGATVRDTALLTVAVRDPDPDQARRLADAVSREFIELVPVLEPQTGREPPAVKVTVVSPAQLPGSPVSPRPVRNLGLAALLGLLAGFGLAMSRRALDTTVQTGEQAEQLTGAPSLGSVQFDPGAGRRPLVDPASHAPRAEDFRKVRTNLQFVNVDRSHRAILVTSAVPEEGKTVTACNLAIALAEAQQRVVVVDADLRSPAVARYLGLPNGVGLTTVLLGRARLAAATQRWGDGPCHALTSGPVPPNPAALLASSRLRSLLEELRAGYDVVLVDAPPTLPVADAAALAAACDGVAVVVRHGRTRHDQLRTAARTLRGAGVPILGTVLNRTPHERGSRFGYEYRPPDPVTGHPDRPAGGAAGEPPPAGVTAEPVAGQ
jgi:capsular exopolysaccharide synthesis family protein